MTIKKILPFISSLVFLGLSFSLLASADIPVDSGRTHALFIGNTHYDSQKWQDLRTSEKDVEVLSRLLIENYGFAENKLTVIKNGNRKKILIALKNLSEVSREQDRVIIYYAGHGAYDKNQLGWWIPVNAEEEYDYISNAEILSRLRAVKARHKLLIADSCFCGSLLLEGAGVQRGLGAPVSLYPEQRNDTEILRKQALKSVQVICSGGNQPVSDGGPKWGGHSIFAYHLIAQLKANKKKMISAAELGSITKTFVSRDTAFLGKPQIPITRVIPSQGDQGGEFYFTRSAPNFSDFQPPILVGFLSASVDKTERGARKIIHQELLEIFQRNGLQADANWFTVGPDKLESTLQQQLLKFRANHMILVDFNLKLEQKPSLIWSAIATISGQVQAYSLKNGKLKPRKMFGFKRQMLPFRGWENTAEFQGQKKSELAQKLVENYAKTDFAAFIRQTFE